MAVSNLSVSETVDALLTTTLKAYRPGLEDNIFGSIPLFYWLNSKGRKRIQNGGEKIRVPLLYGENTTVGEFEGYDVLDVTPQEGMTHAEYSWKSFSVSISINREEERKNSGKYQLIDLLKAKTMQAEKSLQWYLNDTLHGIYGARGKTFCGGDSNTHDSIGGTTAGTRETGSKYINSLDHIVRSPWGMVAGFNATAAVTHTVGGISVSCTNGGAGADWNDLGDWTWSAYTNPWWMNYCVPGWKKIKRGEVGGVPGDRQSQLVLTSAGNYSANSYQNYVTSMRTAYNLVADNGDYADLILTGQEGFEVYEAVLLPLERFTDTKTGDAGFQNLKFKNGTMLLDHGINSAIATPSSSQASHPVYFLNSKYLEWVVDAESDFATTPFFRPENQAARTAQILLMGNLCCSNRSKQAVYIPAVIDANGYWA